MAVKNFVISSVVTISGLCLSSDIHAQAYVDQAGHGDGSVYLDQIPAGAKPQPVLRSNPVKRNVTHRSQATRAAVLAEDSKRSNTPRFPDISTGSSAMVLPSKSEFPSVGRGAVSN